MSDKISETLWKSFVKKQKLEVELGDKDLLKALARFDKTDERKPEERLEALNDLIKEIPKQVASLVKLKKQLGDKPFGLVKDELYGILEEAEGLQKKAQVAPKAGEDEGDDEDSKPDALIDPKLLMKQLMMCRKDPERTMKFAFVDAKGKEQPAMLAMHPRMSARALFTKLQAAAGVKTGAFGSAWVDGMSLMLQLDKPLSGLVKKVRGPVKASGFRITKAVLWNEDGTIFEQEEVTDEAGLMAETGAPAKPVAPNAPPAPPLPSVAYETRHASLMPRIKQAADNGSADAPKHQKLLEFAEGKAKVNDFIGALAALKQIEISLDNPSPRTAEGGEGADPGMAFKARLTTLVPVLKAAEEKKHSVAPAIRLKISEAGVLAHKGDFAAAMTLLAQAEELLGRLALDMGGASEAGGAGGANMPSALPLDAAIEPEARPFQIFVKSLDEMTLTLTLPEGLQTTLGRVQELVEARTGIAPGEQRLMAGSKQFTSGRSALKIGDYDIRREQTLQLLGRLKGGFGERAAIADAILRDIKHGNVLGDIQETKGYSLVKKDLSRELTDSDTVDGEAFLTVIADEAVRTGLIPNTRVAREKWLGDNSHFIDTIGTTCAKSGNCGDYAQVVYSQLLTNSSGQIVYQVEMNDPYDHQFVVTSPNLHDTISALAKDKEAMVADAWWKNTICTFEKFVAKENPYNKKIAFKDMAIVIKQEAAGQALPKTMQDFVKTRFEAAFKKNEVQLAEDATDTEVLATNLANATTEFELLNIQKIDARKKLNKLESRARREKTRLTALNKNVRMAQAALDTARAEQRSLEIRQSDGREKRKKVEVDDTDVRAAGQRLADAQQELATATANRLAKMTVIKTAKTKLASIEASLKTASITLLEAQTQLEGIFGEPGEPWDTGLDDTRDTDELFQTLKQALRLGGLAQLEKDVGHVDDDEFIGFLSIDDDDDGERAAQALNSPRLLARFLTICASAPADRLKEICKDLPDELVVKHVKTVPELAAKLS